MSWFLLFVVKIEMGKIELMIWLMIELMLIGCEFREGYWGLSGYFGWFVGFGWLMYFGWFECKFLVKMFDEWLCLLMGEWVWGELLEGAIGVNMTMMID